MFRLILKRLLLLIPVLIGVTFLVFSILSLAPGDPVLVVLGDNATEEAAEAMRSELGLDKPFLERYVNYIWDLLHGDFGKSYKTKLSVSDQILSRFPNTILLALSSMLIALLFGIPLGILSAKKQYTLLDNVASVGGLISVSMPNFWLGLLLVILFALKLRWLPSQGMGEDTGSMLKSLILPAVTLGTGIMATIMRMTRSSVLETMRQDYVSTARAKGWPGRARPLRRWPWTKRERSPLSRLTSGRFRETGRILTISAGRRALSLRSRRTCRMWGKSCG